MRRKLVVPPPPPNRIRAVVGRRARRRRAVVLADRADRAAYQRTARSVAILLRVAAALPSDLRGSLTADARLGLFDLAVTLNRRAEAARAADGLRLALTAAGLPLDDDRQLKAIEGKIADYTATADHMAGEIEALLRTVEVLVARQSAARFSGPVPTEMVESINLHLDRIDTLAGGIEEAAGLEQAVPHRPAASGRPDPPAAGDGRRGYRGRGW